MQPELQKMELPFKPFSLLKLLVLNQISFDQSQGKHLVEGSSQNIFLVGAFTTEQLKAKIGFLKLIDSDWDCFERMAFGEPEIIHLKNLIQKARTLDLRIFTENDIANELQRHRVPERWQKKLMRIVENGKKEGEHFYTVFFFQKTGDIGKRLLQLMKNGKKPELEREIQNISVKWTQKQIYVPKKPQVPQKPPILVDRIRYVPKPKRHQKDQRQPSPQSKRQSPQKQLSEQAAQTSVLPILKDTSMQTAKSQRNYQSQTTLVRKNVSIQTQQKRLQSIRTIDLEIPISHSKNIHSYKEKEKPQIQQINDSHEIKSREIYLIIDRKICEQALKLVNKNELLEKYLIEISGKPETSQKIDFSLIGTANESQFQFPKILIRKDFSHQFGVLENHWRINFLSKINWKRPIHLVIEELDDLCRLLPTISKAQIDIFTSQAKLNKGSLQTKFRDNLKVTYCPSLANKFPVRKCSKQYFTFIFPISKHKQFIKKLISVKANCDIFCKEIIATLQEQLQQLEFKTKLSFQRAIPLYWGTEEAYLGGVLNRLVQEQTQPFLIGSRVVRFSNRPITHQYLPEVSSLLDINSFIIWGVIINNGVLLVSNTLTIKLPEEQAKIIIDANNEDIAFYNQVSNFYVKRDPIYIKLTALTIYPQQSVVQDCFTKKIYQLGYRQNQKVKNKFLKLDPFFRTEATQSSQIVLKSMKQDSESSIITNFLEFASKLTVEQKKRTVKMSIVPSMDISI